MAVNVGKAFLHEPENGRFGISGPAAEIFGEIEVDGDFAALGEAFDIDLERGAKSHFIEQGRMEEMGNGANIAGHIADQSAAVGHLVCGFGETLKVGGDAGKIHGKGCQQLADAVVKFTGKAASLFVL